MTEKNATKPIRSELSLMGKLYLLAYNIIQTLGWSYLLFQSAIHFLDRGPLETYWSEIKWTVILFQGAAVLEVVHSLLGLVSSGFMVVLMQVYSRVFLVFGVLLLTHGATVSPGLPLCVFAWSVTEIIRYAYYGFNLIHLIPPPLTFLRYSTFLVLYPLGITGELLCMYHSLEEVAEKRLFTASMPNEWNYIFNYQYFMIAYMLLYIPLFPVLFGHMLSQRKKVLGSSKQKTK